MMAAFLQTTATPDLKQVGIFIQQICNFYFDEDFTVHIWRRMACTFQIPMADSESCWADWSVLISGSAICQGLRDLDRICK